MKKTTGSYPRVRVDTSASGAVGQAGGVLLTQTVTATGMGPELSGALARWRKPLAVHDSAKVITDLAVMLALGGDCLADVAVLRTEPGVYGVVASDPTISRTIAALAADAPAALKAIDTARGRGPGQGVGAGRRGRARGRHRRDQPVDHRPGRHPGDLAQTRRTRARRSSVHCATARGCLRR